MTISRERAIIGNGSQHPHTLPAQANASVSRHAGAPFIEYFGVLSARDNPHLVHRASNFGAEARLLLKLPQRPQAYSLRLISLGRSPGDTTFTSSLSRLLSFAQRILGSSRRGSRMPLLLHTAAGRYLVIYVTAICSRNPIPPSTLYAVVGEEGGLDIYLPPRNPCSGAAMWDQGILLLVAIRLR